MQCSFMQNCYSESDGDTYSYSKGKYTNLSILDELKDKADKGDPDSMYKYADMLYKGEGPQLNKAKTFEYFSNAAFSGNVDARRRCAIMIYNGDGVEKDIEKATNAFKCFVEISQDYVLIGHYAALLYEKDDNLCMFYFNRTSNRNVDSMRELALIFYKKGNKKNAINFFKKAIQEGNDIISMHCYSFMLCNGIDRTRNGLEAKEYMEKVGEKNADDLFKHGVKLYEGVDSGPMDKMTGKRYIQLAKDKESYSAKKYCTEHKIESLNDYLLAFK